MAATKEVTNEDLLSVMQDLMQMTHEGFERVDKRFERIENRLDHIEEELRVIKQRLNDHDMQLAELRSICNQLLNNHQAHMNDIKDLLDRVKALESKAPDITKDEVRELQRLLKIIVDWALKVAKATKVPLKI